MGSRKHTRAVKYKTQFKKTLMNNAFSPFEVVTTESEGTHQNNEVML